MRVLQRFKSKAMVDHPFVIMQPSSGEPVYLRFIEDERRR